MTIEYEKIGIHYTTTDTPPAELDRNLPYFPDDSLYYNGYGRWPNGLLFTSPTDFAFIQRSVSTFRHYIFSTSVLAVTSDPTEFNAYSWSSTPTVYAFQGTNYLGGYEEIAYKPYLWVQIDASNALFTDQADIVDFNHLKPDQQA